MKKRDYYTKCKDNYTNKDMCYVSFGYAHMWVDREPIIYDL